MPSRGAGRSRPHDGWPYVDSAVALVADGDEDQLGAEFIGAPWSRPFVPTASAGVVRGWRLLVGNDDQIETWLKKDGLAARQCRRTAGAPWRGVGATDAAPRSGTGPTGNDRTRG